MKVQFMDVLSNFRITLFFVILGFILIAVSIIYFPRGHIITIVIYFSALFLIVYGFFKSPPNLLKDVQS